MRLLQGIATREVVHYLASADFDELDVAWSRGRGRRFAPETCRRRPMRCSLGARIVFVGLEDIHPPSKVAKYFEKVVGAAETREAKILQAQAYSISTNAWASAEASNRVWTAEADHHRDDHQRRRPRHALYQSSPGLRRRSRREWRL